MKTLKSNIVSIVSVIVILACTLPMVYFFRYSVLGGDDFLYGRETFHAIKDTGSYFDAVGIAFRNTAESYMNWQGSFFSIFLMYLHPGIVSLSLYRVTLALIFILGIVSPCVAAFTLNKYYLKAPKKYIWLMLASYIFAVTQYMPSIYQAHYWYNSTIYYQFTFSIAMLFIAAFIKYRHAKKKYTKGLLIAALIFMSVMIGGSNFPLGLVFAAAFALYVAIAHIKKWESRWTDTIIFCVFLAVFLINVLAPGNGERQAGYNISPGLFPAGIASVRDMLVEMPVWIKNTITLGIICAMLPVGRKITENSKLKFVHPAAAGLVIAFLLLAQYYPVEYGLGSKGPLRVENLRFMMLTLGLWLFFINMFGYLKEKEKPVNKFVAAVLAIALIAFPLAEKGINSFTSYVMTDQIIHGELVQFAEVMDSEIAQLESDGKEPVSYENHMTNLYLHPEAKYWFQSGIWEYYRKVPKRN